MLTNIHNNSILKMTNQTTRFTTTYYEACIIITDREIFEGDTVEFKQSKKYMGAYKIYQDDDNIEGKNIYVCKIKKQITFQLRDDDGYRMKLLNVTHIDTNKIKSYKDIIEIDSDTINIFDLILYLGLEIKQEWFDFSKLIEMMQLRKYFDNHRVTDVPRRELFDMFSNYVNEDNLEELNMMIDRYKFFIMSGNNDAYFLAALFGKGIYISCGKETVSTLHMVGNLLNEFVDKKKFVKGLLETCNGLGMREYIEDYMSEISKTYDTRLEAVEFVGDMEMWQIELIYYDFGKNYKEYFRTIPGFKDKILNNTRNSVTNMVLRLINCVPRGFEREIDNLGRFDKCLEMSINTQAIYSSLNELMNTPQIVSIFKLISYYEEGEEKDFLIDSMSYLFFRQFNNISSPTIPENYFEYLYCIDYMFTAEDVERFILTLMYYLEQADDGVSRRYLEVIMRLDLCFKNNEGDGIKTISLFRKHFKTSRIYKIFNLEMKLKR